MKATSVAAHGVIYLVELYRNTISSLRLPTCRFTPTCSQYTLDALTTYGVFRGGWLSVVRLAKCGPWHRGGWDPIPLRDGRCAPHTNRGADAAAADAAADEDDVWGTPAERGESKPRV